MTMKTHYNNMKEKNPFAFLCEETEHDFAIAKGRFSENPRRVLFQGAYIFGSDIP